MCCGGCLRSSLHLEQLKSDEVLHTQTGVGLACESLLGYVNRETNEKW